MRSKAVICTILLGMLPALAGAQSTQSRTNTKPDKAAAYYHFSMGHLYAELAGAYNNRGEYLNKAIDHYRQAIKADPAAGFLMEELAELYIQAGRLKEAVSEAEEALKQNPDDLNMRRLLGRIYTRLIGDSNRNTINEEMLRKAIEQYEKIAASEPADVAVWLMLGRLQKVAQNSPQAETAYKKILEIEPDNEDALTGLAMVYADVGDTKAAAELLEKVSEKNPSVRTLAALSAAYEQMRDYESAATALGKALELSPENIEIKRRLAQSLLFADKLEEAKKLFEEIAAEEPRDPTAQLRLSQIYRQQRQFDKAREASRKAQEIDPNNIEIRYNDVSLLEAEGKLPEAIEALKHILSTTSRRSYSSGERGNRAILLERLGYLQRSALRYDDAVATFQEMAKLDADQAPRAALHIIETYRVARQTDKAFEEARSAREKFPKDRSLQSMYAFIAADAGKAEEAESVARKLIAETKDRETWISLAQIYERTHNYEEMSKALDEAEKLSESSAEKETIFFMRGAMFEKMKKFDAAEAEFRKVLASNPSNSSALNYLGYMLADRNVRLNEALTMIQKAVNMEPDNGAYLDSLGWVYYRLDRLEEAEDYLKRALDRTPNDPTIHEHLGDVYSKQGNLKEAINLWEKSIQQWQSTPKSEQDAAAVAGIQKKLEGARVRQARENSVK